MMLRVYAIWGRDIRILVALGFLWVVQVAFCAMALAYSQRTWFLQAFSAKRDGG